jgi:hypothetical protein
LKALAACSAVSFILALPWLVWTFWPANVPMFIESTPHSTFSQMLACRETWFEKYVSQINEYVFSPIFYVVLAVIAIVGFFQLHYHGKQFPRLDVAAKQGCVLIAIITVISVVTPSAAAPYYNFRYLTPLIPLLCILAARILEAAIRVRVGFGILVFAVVLATSPMHKYLYEITHHLRTPTEAIVEYLNKHADPNDTVAVSYGDMPLKFYTKLRIVGSLTGEDLSLVDSARWAIQHYAPGYTKSRTIDRKTLQCQVVPIYMLNFLEKNASRYDTIKLDCFDTLFDNRECPDMHIYWPPTIAEAEILYAPLPKPMLIYRAKTKTDSVVLERRSSTKVVAE